MTPRNELGSALPRTNNIKHDDCWALIDPVGDNLDPVQSEIGKIVKDVEHLLCKEICRVKAFTQQFALMRQMLEPFSTEGSPAWKGVEDLRAFKEKIGAAKQVVKLCQLEESVSPTTPRDASTQHRLLPAAVSFDQDPIDKVLVSLLKDVRQRRQPPQDQQEAQMWEIQEKKEGELQPTELEKGSFAEDLLGENNFNGSLVQRSLCVAAAAYGKFSEQRHGLGGINEWQDLVVTKLSDLAVFGIKRKEGGSSRIEIGIRGTVPDYSDQWFFESGNANVELAGMDGVEGKVHSGFLTAYIDGSPSMQQAIRGKVSQELENTRRPVAEVLVSGHSRGAALATLCAVDLALHFPDVRILLVTYASPRVGDGRFVTFCQQLEAQKRLRSARFVNRFDPVAHMPAQHGTITDAVQRFLLGDLGQNSGYEHLGKAVVLDWYSQNMCRLINSPQKAVAGVHDLARYGENLRNRFRDFRSVCLESVAPLAKTAIAYIGIFCVSQVTGSAVATMVKMNELEQTIKNEARDIKDTVVQQAGQVMNGVKDAAETILAAISDNALQERVRDLLSRTNVLQTQVRSGMVNVELCTRTHEAAIALVLAAQDVPKETHEELLIYILHALEIMGIAYISSGLRPNQLLTWMQEVARHEHLVQLIAEVCSKKATDQKLSRRQVQKFLQDFSWPEGKDGGQLILALQRLQRLIITVMIMSGERGSLGMHKSIAAKVHPGRFNGESGDSWEGWCLTCDESRQNGTTNASGENRLIRTTAKIIIDVDGSTYRGSLEDGIPYGHGEAVCRVAGFEVYRYRGGFRMHVMHGQGKYSLPDGTVVHDGVWNHGQPVQVSKVTEVLESLSKMQLAMPRKVFQRALAVAKTHDSENEAVLQRIQRKKADFFERPVTFRDVDIRLSDSEDEDEEIGKELDLVHRRMEFKKDVKQLITDLSAACIFCDRVNASTKHTQLAVMKEAGIDSALFADLQTLAQKVSNTKVRIPIMGPVKAGKSTAINAMMAERLSPSDTQPMTVLPMVIEHSTDLQCPTFSVPFPEIYTTAAKKVYDWLHQPSLQKLQEGLLGTGRNASMSSDADAEHWVLTTPEIEVFAIINEGKFTVEAHLELSNGPSDGYHMVEKLNKLCRIFARAHFFLDRNIAKPYAQLRELYHEMRKTSRITKEDYEDAFDLVQKLRNSLNMSPVAEPRTVDGTEIFLPPWKDNDKEKVLRVVWGTLTASWKALQEADVPKWGNGLLARLLDAGKKGNRCPWPRVQMKMALFAQQQLMNGDGGEMPTAFEIIDTPGLDETHLLPEIRRVVQFLMEGAQATIFVCNSLVLGTEAFNGALTLIKQIQAFRVPVLVLANFLEGKPKRKKEQVCKDIAKQIFNEEQPGSRVYPASARSAFLSSRIQRFTDEGRLPALCSSMLDCQIAEEKLNPDEEDVYDALDMANAQALMYQLDDADEPDGDELAEALGSTSINFLQKRGGFIPFVDQVKTKLAPKALAMEVQSSLIRLVGKKGTLYRLLAVVGDAVSQITETGNDIEKNERLWSAFRINVLEKKQEGFNKEHEERAIKDIRDILTEEYEKISSEELEALKPTGAVNDEGEIWLAKTMQDRNRLGKEAWKHARVAAKRLAKKMKENALPRLKNVWEDLDRTLNEEVSALNCPKAGLARLLKQAKFEIPKVELPSVGTLFYTFEARRAEKTWWQFFMFRSGDIQGYCINKAELHEMIEKQVRKYLIAIMAQWHEDFAQAPPRAIKAYTDYVDRLVREAQEQHVGIQEQRSEPTFHEAQMSAITVYELIKECYHKALKLKEQIQEDPFEL